MLRLESAERATIKGRVVARRFNLSQAFVGVCVRGAGRGLVSVGGHAERHLHQAVNMGTERRFDLCR